MSNDMIETHPVQMPRILHQRRSRVPKVVTMAAYEVHCHVFTAQLALVTGECRGGFGINELTAFLYARSFPRSEWRMRVDEALKGMENL